LRLLETGAQPEGPGTAPNGVKPSAAFLEDKDLAKEPGVTLADSGILRSSWRPADCLAPDSRSGARNDK